MPHASRRFLSTLAELLVVTALSDDTADYVVHVILLTDCSKVRSNLLST